MTIRYNNGNAVEAILLAQTETSMRVLTRGAEDVAELQRVNGTWISEDWEPAWIDFGGRASACPPETAWPVLDAPFRGSEPELGEDAAGTHHTAPMHLPIM